MELGFETGAAAVRLPQIDKFFLAGGAVRKRSVTQRLRRRAGRVPPSAWVFGGGCLKLGKDSFYIRAAYVKSFLLARPSLGRFGTAALPLLAYMVACGPSAVKCRCPHRPPAYTFRLLDLAAGTPKTDGHVPAGKVRWGAPGGGSPADARPAPR